ncbi:MAG: CoA-binding protein [Spirochaetota bacterium]
MKESIKQFIAQKHIAVIGVSRSGKKFSNTIYRELKNDGYTVYPVNPNAGTVEGDKCYPSIAALPKAVTATVVVVPPAETLAVVTEAAKKGIKHIWLQQGAESDEAEAYCKTNELSFVSGRCLFMYVKEHAFPHSIHAVIAKLFRRF